MHLTAADISKSCNLITSIVQLYKIHYSCFLIKLLTHIYTVQKVFITTFAEEISDQKWKNKMIITNCLTVKSLKLKTFKIKNKSNNKFGTQNEKKLI